MRKMIATTAVSVLALGVAACGQQQPEPAAPPPAPAATATPEAAPEATQTPGDDRTGAAQDADARNAGALQAIATAADAAGGTPYEIDDADGDQNWEVKVMVGDRSHEVTVSGDGTQVIRQQDEAGDNEDRRRLEQAVLPLGQVIETALREVPGALDDVDLDEKDGTIVWEVSIDTPEHADVEVLIDVRTGGVFRVDR